MSYPFDGQMYPSSEKTFSELVFFVHFYQGSKRAMLRHIRAVNQLGFDAFAFNLQGADSIFQLPLNPHGQFGYKHLFAEQIERLLNLLPQPKIVFAFSNPAASAIEALARRKCFDVRALICDSGPSAQLEISAFQLARKYAQERKWKKALITATLLPGWSPFFHRDIHQQLEQFPDNFPVLSIRGWKDRLIPPQDIDRVFEPHPRLSWKKLTLPEAGHLDGLKKHSDEYLRGLKDFLLSVAGSPTSQT